MPAIKTVLIANRGEIAVRIMRTLQSQGVRPVTVYAADDATSPHVTDSPHAVRLAGDDMRATYLNIEQIIAVAKREGADAIHPGYGFLAENAQFARACEAAGIIFIGPRPAAIETMGDKIAARAAVESRGVATVPGIARPDLTDDELIEGAASVGYPVLIKPAAGGGGKGMHRVDVPEGLPDALRQARREAASAFGDDTLFIERFVTNPRHIEVQILADEHGNVIHLGERECSLQRRHQKVVEEAPSALLTPVQRAHIGQAAVETARSVDYRGAGTVEFIVSADRPDEPFFMEMNTRLQVEHPVTEMVTGIDLVEQQLAIARGEALTLQQGDVAMDGHAIEVRVYAEDPAHGFVPTGGTIDGFWVRGYAPFGSCFPAETLNGTAPHDETHSTRVDSGVTAGTVVGSRYDPMIAKVIVHEQSREEALVAMDTALAGTRTSGVVTNINFLRALLADEDVRAGRLDTGLIERKPELATALDVDRALAIAAIIDAERYAMEVPTVLGAWSRHDGWRLGAPEPTRLRYVHPHTDEPVTVEVLNTKQSEEPRYRVRVDGGSWRDVLVRGDIWCEVEFDLGAEQIHVLTDYVNMAKGVWLAGAAGQWHIERAQRRRRAGDAEAQPSLASPMPGTVVQLHVASGDAVSAGDAVVSVEAMKMEHVLRAPVDGIVTIEVSVGQTVARGQELAIVAATTSGTAAEQESA